MSHNRQRSPNSNKFRHISKTVILLSGGCARLNTVFFRRPRHSFDSMWLCVQLRAVLQLCTTTTKTDASRARLAFCARKCVTACSVYTEWKYTCTYILLEEWLSWFCFPPKTMACHVWHEQWTTQRKISRLRFLRNFCIAEGLSWKLPLKIFKRFPITC